MTDTHPAGELDLPTFPTFEPPREPIEREDGARVYEGQIYALESGYRPHKLDLWVPATSSPPPLVVWIHGGAWMMGDRRQLLPTIPLDAQFEAVLARGLAVASIDYRLAKEALFPAQLHDAKAAVRWLRHHAAELGYLAEPMGIWGESAGGHLAALVALTADRSDLEGDVGLVGPSSAVQACVDWYGVSDVDAMPQFPPAPIRDFLPEKMREAPIEVITGGDPERRRDLSPVSHAHAGAPPFLVQHGTGDVVVPHSQSEALVAALEAAGVPVTAEYVEGADHCFGGHDDVAGVVDRAVEFLARSLSPRADR